MNQDSMRGAMACQQHVSEMQRTHEKHGPEETPELNTLIPHGPFEAWEDVDVVAPPAIENMCKPASMESAEENISLSQVPPPQPGSHARGQ